MSAMMPVYSEGAAPIAGGFAASQPPRDLCADLTQMAMMGAVVGATGSAGAQIHALQRGTITVRQAVVETSRVALVSGAATAVAGAAAHAFASNGITRLAVLLAAGTAVIYAAQGFRDREDATL